MSNKKQLLAQYDSLYKWFSNALVDFTDDETNERVHKNMNHVKYVAGHIMNAQYGLAWIAGVKVESKWDELFAGQGKTKALDDYPYPSIEDIKAEWEQLCPLIRKGLETLPEESLEKELPGSPLAGSKVFDATVGDFWAFLIIHQIYHIGQIGILRRGFNKEPMKYR